MHKVEPSGNNIERNQQAISLSIPSDSTYPHPTLTRSNLRGSNSNPLIDPSFIQPHSKTSSSNTVVMGRQPNPMRLLNANHDAGQEYRPLSSDLSRQTIVGSWAHIMYISWIYAC